MKSLWCRLFGHAATTDWYMPWRRRPMTGQYIDREILTVCGRCKGTLSTRVGYPIGSTPPAHERQARSVAP